jgi:hypothetical protein
LKDGTQTVTANIPFAGFKLTGVGPATARTDAATIATIQDGTGVYVGTVGGTGNAITLTPSPAITAYGAGQRFYFVPGSTNSGATTVAISGLAAKNVFLNGAACVGNEITLNIPATITYDGTQFNLVAPAHAVTTDTTQTISGAKTFSTAPKISMASPVLQMQRAASGQNELFQFLDEAAADKWDFGMEATSNDLIFSKAGIGTIIKVGISTGGVQVYNAGAAPTGGDPGAGGGNFAGALKINNVAVPTISSSDTLTNKTLTSPVINSATGIGQAIVKRKTADESVTSSTTLQDDDHLTFAIAANEEWECDLFARIGSNLTSTGVKVAITFPAGATAAFDPTVISDQSGQSRTEPLGTSGSGSSTFTTTLLSGSVNGVLFGRIWILNGATPGNVTLQWAQMTSNGSALTFSKGSKLVCHRIA